MSAEWARSARRLIICCFLYFLGLSRSLGLPTVGPEFDLGFPTYGAAFNSQYSPGIAFDGNVFFVVWEDYRDNMNTHIYGTRVTPSGEVLDPKGIKIDTSTSTSYYNPRVMSDGFGFIVTWENVSSMYARRVTAEGQLGDGYLFRTNLFSIAAPPTNGTNSLIVWAANGDIFGARVQPNGTFVDPVGFPICTETNSQDTPAACALGENWMVIWKDYRRDAGDIFGTLISPAGVVLFTNGVSICSTQNAQGNARIVAAGNKCLAIWDDSRTASMSRIHGARIDSTGRVMDTNGFLIGFNPKERLGGVASDGQDWMVSWASEINGNSCQTFSRGVTSQGSLVSQVELEYTATQFSRPDVAFAHTNYLAVWQSRQAGGAPTLDIVGKRMSPTGVAVDASPFAVGLSANPQRQPAIADDGTNYLAVWSDGRRGDGRWDIYATRISKSGEVLDPHGIPITTLNTAETGPAVAFNGYHFLVAWSDSRHSDYREYLDVYAARVDRNGQVLETNGFLVATTSRSGTLVDVASLGTNFLVVWNGAYSTAISVSGARVSGNSELLDPTPISFHDGGGSPRRPKAAANGNVYLVKWVANFNGSVTMNGAGAILFSNYPAGNSALNVASSGNHFLGVRSSSSGVSGYLIPESGVWSSMFSLSPAPSAWDGYLIAIARNSKDYLLVYGPASTPGSPMYLTQVSRTGSPIQPNYTIDITNHSIIRELAMAGNRTDDYLLLGSHINSQEVSRLAGRALMGAPRLGSPQKNLSLFSFRLDGAAERVYEIQSSTDLVSWGTEFTFSNHLGSVNIVTNMSDPKRFFRALQMP